MTPEDARPLVEGAIKPCAGCGKDTITDWDRQSLERAQHAGERVWTALRTDPALEDLKERVYNAKEGKILEYVTATNVKLQVCAGRGSFGTSDACRFAAVGKAARCPVCGEQTYRWPAPCPTCDGLVRRYREKAALDAARADTKAVRLAWDLPRAGPNDKYVEAVLRPLLEAFHLDPRQDRRADLSIPADPPYYDRERGPVVKIDQPQYEALAEFYRWLKALVATTEAEAFAKGSALLNQLIAGKTTMDNLNDEVAKRAAAVQAAEGKEPTPWT